MNRRLLRKVKNGVFLSLSLVATLTGLACLAAILWTLLSHGVSGLSGRIFTQMTPPPGSQGGLLNAIYGSGVMTLLGILIGSPIGVLAGTYLAEYGKNSRLSVAIRFINDVLLSALGRVLGGWVGDERVVVDLEGHGREDLFGDVDLSRTVGWFTSMFPVALSAAGGWADVLKSVKEGLRSVPRRGIGFGALRHLGDGVPGTVEPQVSFNYLGQFDSDSGPFTMRGELDSAVADDKTRDGRKMNRRVEVRLWVPNEPTKTASNAAGN